MSLQFPSNKAVGRIGAAYRKIANGQGKPLHACVRSGPRFSISASSEARHTVAFPEYPSNRTCGVHAKIDENDPLRYQANHLTRCVYRWTPGICYLARRLVLPLIYCALTPLARHCVRSGETNHTSEALMSFKNPFPASLAPSLPICIDPTTAAHTHHRL